MKELAAMQGEIELLRRLLREARFHVLWSTASEGDAMAAHAKALLAQIDGVLTDSIGAIA